MARKLALVGLLLSCLALGAHAARLADSLGKVELGRQQKGGANNNKKAAAGGVKEDDGPTQYKNTKPLIGILTQPCHECPGKSYIAAGYVKWIEAAGGRAVPIRFYASDDELHRLFKSLNGIVFAGGLTWLWLDSPYVIAARKLWNWILEANDNGDVFPIHGTCLGFQLLHILASNISRNYLLVDTDSVAHPTTLQFTEYAANSRMFGGMRPDLLTKLSSDKYNIALENHMYGIPPSYYHTKGNGILAEWYRPLSTTFDRNGTEYISTMEGIKYPFFGTQWHPEKPPYEFGMEEIPHSLDAISVSQHLANVFIEHARMSSHTPESHEEELALQIYDIPLVFSARFEAVAEDNYDGPDMTYYLDEQDKPPSGPDDDEGGGGDSDAAALRARQQQQHLSFWKTQGGIF